MRKGFFVRQRAPRRIQRYACRHCGRSFSAQTFALDYWLKKPGRLEALFHRLVGCSALRQIAREFEVAPSTVQRHTERLGRHCLLVHEALRPRGAPEEPLALDGFQSLEAGHYWPFELNHAVGVSHFVYGVGEAELRRSGRMTPGQRRHRACLEARYGRPDPRATERSVRELLERLVPEGATVTIRSDEHSDYPRALAGLPGRHIRHETTSSKARRTAANPLFPVNLADMLLRHTGANHKRETIAFSKRRQGALWRVMVFVVWRNYVQWSAERWKTPPPGVAVGAIPRRLAVREVLRTRRFPWKAKLRGWLADCYFGRIRTRRLAGRDRIHDLAYAV